MAINVDKIVKADRNGIVMFIHIIRMSDNEKVQTGNVLKFLDWHQIDKNKERDSKPGFKRTVINKDMILEEYDKDKFIEKYPYLFI